MSQLAVVEVVAGSRWGGGGGGGGGGENPAAVVTRPRSTRAAVWVVDAGRFPLDEVGPRGQMVEAVRTSAARAWLFHKSAGPLALLPWYK